MGLPLTIENKAKAMRCLLKNSKLNAMGFYEVNGGNPQTHLAKVFPHASPQEINNLLDTMLSEHIISDGDLSRASFTYRSGFLERLDEERKNKRHGNMKYIISALIALAGVLVALLKWFKP